MTERTPGPWREEPHEFGGGCWWVNTPNGKIQVSMDNHDKDEAYARLIAAAPNMEKALETAAYVLEHYLDYTQNDMAVMAEDARAALAKARGDSDDV